MKRKKRERRKERGKKENRGTVNWLDCISRGNSSIAWFSIGGINAARRGGQPNEAIFAGKIARDARRRSDASDR